MSIMELSEQSLKRIQSIVAVEVANKVSNAICDLDIDTKIKVANDDRYNELMLKISDLKADQSALRQQYTERTEYLLRCLNEMKTKLNDAERERDELRYELDDLQQYGRRKSVRIENIPVPTGEQQETTEELLASVKEKLKEIEIEIEDTDVVRLHRNSKARPNKEGVNCAQTLLKLSNWKAREKFSGANKTAYRKKKNVRVHNDLTQRRFSLLKYARERTERAMARRFPNKEQRDRLPFEKKVFAYSNLQSDLKFRVGKLVHSFNTFEEFDDLFARKFPDQTPGRGADAGFGSDRGRGGRRGGGTRRQTRRSPLAWNDGPVNLEDVLQMNPPGHFWNESGTDQRRGRSPR